MADFISAILGAGMSGWGLQQQMHQNKWLEDYTINQLNNARASQGLGQDVWTHNMGLASDKANGLSDTLSALFGGNGGSAAQLNDLLQQYPGMREALLGSGADPFGRGMNNGMQDALQGQKDLLGQYGNNGAIASQLFAGGGWTPQRSGTQDRFMDLLNGQGAQMGTLGDVGTSLLGSRGQTAFSQGLQDRGMDAANAGGMTSTLDAAKAEALRQIQAGGGDPNTNALQSKGLDLFSQNPLLPMDQVYNNAREASRHDTESAYRRLQRAALARGGNAQSIVAAGGAEKDPASEWADAAASNEADAGRNALVAQQGLGLQRSAQGLNAADIAGNQKNNRYLAALGILPATQNSATNFAGTMGNLGLGAAGAENQRMQTGNQSLQQYLQGIMGGGGLMNDSLSSQQNYALGGGQLSNQYLQSLLGGNQNIFGNNLAAGGFGQQRNLDQFNGFNNNVSNMSTFNNNNLQGILSSAGLLQNLGGQGLQYALGGLTGQGNAPNYANTLPAFQNMAAGLSKVGFGGMPKAPGTGGGVPGYDPDGSQG